MVQHPPTRYLCKELFGADSAPNTCLYTSMKPQSFINACDDIKKVYDDEQSRRRVGELQVKTDLLETNTAVKRKAAAAKAREARTQSSAQKRQARRVTLC